MTNNEQRREVAASLRVSANVGGARTSKRELAKALGIQLDRYTPEGSHTKILRGLADLIDPPTTTHICGKCGGERPSDIMFEYRPYCGTVADDAER